jgi:hypothetical protein
MQTTQEILEKHNLNWEVEKLPLYYKNENDGNEYTDYYAIARKDTGEVFTTCKEGYTPTQNEAIIDTMQEIAGNNDLHITKAIPLHGGRKIMIQMQRPDNTFSIGKELTKEYIYAINGHDGSSSLRFGFMNEVLFCKNQFAWMANSALSAYRHTESIQRKVKELPKIINFTDQEEKIGDLQQFSIQKIDPIIITHLVDYLTSTDRELTEDERLEMLSTRKLNMRANLMTCLHSELHRIGGTKWGAFNGVTKFTTHFKSTPKREFGLEESIYSGSCMDWNNKAFNFLKEN